MKFALSTIIASALFFSSVMAAPIPEETGFTFHSTDFPKASITISNPSVSPPSAVTLADAMSSTTATASISIQGHDASAQSISGSNSNFLMSPALTLPIAAISAIVLM